MAVENTKGSFTVSANDHADLSETINIQQGDKITNRPNPPVPHSKERIGEPGNNTLSQGTNDPYALIRTAIERAKMYPLLARKKRIEGTAVMGFTIDEQWIPAGSEGPKRAQAMKSLIQQLSK